MFTKNMIALGLKGKNLNLRSLYNINHIKNMHE